MGRAADSLERTCGALEQESRPSWRAHPDFSRRRLGQTGSRAQPSILNSSAGDRRTHHLSLRANRHGLEHAPEVTFMADEDEALKRIRAIAAGNGERAERARLLAETVRSLGNYRWTGIYDVGSEFVS